MNSSDSIMHRVLPYHNRAFHPVFLDLVLERVNAMAERFCGPGHTFQQYADQTLGGDHRAYDLFDNHRFEYSSKSYEHEMASALFQVLLSVPRMEQVLFIQSIQKYTMHLDEVLKQLCGFHPDIAFRNDPTYAQYTPIFDFVGAVLVGMDNQTPFSIFRSLLHDMSDEQFQVCMELTLHHDIRPLYLLPRIAKAVSVFYERLGEDKRLFFAWILSGFPGEEDFMNYDTMMFCPQDNRDITSKNRMERYFLEPLKFYTHDAGLFRHDVHRMHTTLKGFQGESLNAARIEQGLVQLTTSESDSENSRILKQELKKRGIFENGQLLSEKRFWDWAIHEHFKGVIYANFKNFLTCFFDLDGDEEEEDEAW